MKQLKPFTRKKGRMVHPGPVRAAAFMTSVAKEDLLSSSMRETALCREEQFLWISCCLTCSDAVARIYLCLQCSCVAAALSEDSICSFLLLQGRSWCGWVGRRAHGHSLCCGYSAGKKPQNCLLECFEYVNGSVGNPISSQDRAIFSRW